MKSEKGKGEEFFYGLAEQLGGYQAANLRAMALAAHQYYRDDVAMRAFSLSWGRNARTMACAVRRFPLWFFEIEDGHGNDSAFIEASPDELLSLFTICRLPKPESLEFYKKWRDHSWLYWQVRERVQDWFERRKASDKAQQIRVVAKGCHVVSIDGKAVTISLPESGLLPGKVWSHKQCAVTFSRTEARDDAA